MNQCVNMFIDRDEWWPIAKQTSIKVGSASNGDTLPITLGYKNHIFFISPKSGHAVSSNYPYEIASSGYEIHCEVDQSTRKVTAYIEAGAGGLGPGGNIQWVRKSLSVNYIEFAY